MHIKSHPTLLTTPFIFMHKSLFNYRSGRLGSSWLSNQSCKKVRPVEIYRWKFCGCAGGERIGGTMEEWEKQRKLLLQPNVVKIVPACQLAFATSFTIMYLTVPSNSGFGSCPNLKLSLPAHVTCFWPQEQWRLTVSVYQKHRPW